MGAHKKSQVMHRSPGVTIISGRFRPNGNGTVSVYEGDGFTVSRTGVGAFTVSLTGKWTRLVHFAAQYWGAALTAGSVIQVVGAISLGATATTVPIVHSLNAAGTFAAAEIASDAANWISFEAHVSDTAELS